MAYFKYFAAITLLFLMAACGGGGSNNPTPEPITQTNRAPVIVELSASSIEAFNGETITLSATATDADNDALTYTFEPSESFVCQEGLMSARVTVTDGKGGSDSQSIGLSCYLNISEVTSYLISNLNLTALTSGGSVDSQTLDFSATTSNGTRLGFVHDSSVDFSNHNDISAQGVAGSAQSVISIAKTTDNLNLPTSFEPAQDLLLISQQSSVNNVCINITADETLEGTLSNINQVGSYQFEGIDLESSTLSFQGESYSFFVSSTGVVDLAILANQVYSNDGATGIEKILDGREMNFAGKLNDVCDVSLLINPFTESDPYPLITINDLEYQGAFVIPGATYGESNAHYANGKIEYNPTNNSIYIIGNANQQAIAEFEIPELVNSLDINELNAASAPLQNFTKILDKTSNPQNINRVTGMKLFGNQMMVNGLEYYDAAADNTDTTIMIRDVSGINASAVDGYYSMNGKAHAAGWISQIPVEWQELLGGTYISGNASNLPIAGRNSIGPTAFIFDPTLLLNSFTTKDIPATPLIDFSLQHPLHEDQYNNDRDNDLWTVISRAQYGFIVPNTRTYVTIGSSGGHEFGIGYKATQDTGRLCGGPCSLVAADNYNYYWLWDVNDMLAVKNGEKFPYEVRPYKYGEFNIPFQTDVRNNNATQMHAISGATFDYEKGLLYITIGGADSRGAYSANPVIVAYKIKNYIAP